MKRVWRHFRAASVTAGVGGLLLASCAHDDSSMYVIQIVVPPTPTANQGCLYGATSGATPGLFNGELDVGLASTYSPVALIGNQLNARSDSLNVRTETARISIRGAIVRVTDSLGNQLSTFTSLSEGTVDPENGTTPGVGLAAVTLVDPATSNALKQQLANRAARKTIVSYFKVYGNTLGGTYVESAEYQHVIEVCNGCLVTFPSDADNPAPNLPQPNCLAGLASGAAGAASSTIALPCVTGQDQLVDCRFCQGLDACDPQKLR
jgi:hypothetical protein